MNESGPSREKKPGAAATTRGAPAKGAAPRRDNRPPAVEEVALKVRFWSAMKPNKVYPLVIRAPREETAPKGGLEIRPQIPGSIVVPAAQKLDLTRPGSEVIFQVTPLARGRLVGAHLDLLQPGQPPKKLAMRMRGKTQRFTCFLALLTMLIPGLMLWGMRYHDLSTQGNPSMVSSGSPEKPFPEFKLGGITVRPEDLPEKPNTQPNQPGRVGLSAPPSPGTRPPVQPPKPLAPPIEHFIKDNVHPIGNVTDECAYGLQKAYDWVHGFLPEHIIFWVALVLLLLTLVSWAGHWPWRTSMTRYVQVATAPVAVPQGDTLALEAGDDVPRLAEPAD